MKQLGINLLNPHSPQLSDAEGMFILLQLHNCQKLPVEFAKHKEVVDYSKFLEVEKKADKTSITLS